MYVRTSISGSSLDAKLGSYLNIEETTFSRSSEENSSSDHSDHVPAVHEQALAAILEAVISNTNDSFECVRVPAPEGGVQEWWARMLGGSIKNSEMKVRVQL